MEIRIHIPRPLLTLTVAGVFVLWWTGVISVQMPWGGPAGALTGDIGGGQKNAALITDAVQDIDRQRVMQAVLGKQEEILRYQLAILEEDAMAADTAESMKKLAETRAILLSIIKQRDNSEKLLKLSLEQLWDAEGSTYTLRRIDIATELDWPVEPRLGISAHFQDDGYKARFGVDHHAIDIPVPQGTPIRTPADATVAKVSLNGLGYSYIVLDHGNGLQTIYGHVTDAVVKAGDEVTFGQIIGYSGGQPGTQGAGLLTTGPHLHFAVRVDGALVDPLEYLPRLQGVSLE
jgi:murein DD-endopeptidase MepM/ murein hydrolase activator NlpD